MGETFLESEVEYLSKYFEEIWIMPARSVWCPSLFRNDMFVQRKLPVNFKIYVPENAGLLALTAFRASLEIRKRAEMMNCSAVPRYIRERLAWREAFKAAILSVSIKKLVKKNEIPIFAYSYWKGESSTALAYLVEKRIINGFITRCHRGDLYDEVLPYPFRPYDPMVLKEADILAPISIDGAKYLQQKNVPPSKIIVHRLGVKESKRISLPSDDGILRIVSCSNLIPVKRVDIIANALTQLNLPFQWNHFGDGIERNKIEQIISKFPLDGMALLPGRLPNQEILNHYANNPVDVFVNVSSSEGVPVSIMEALSYGIPCISTDVGGVSELVDSSCGILLEKSITSLALAKRLGELIPQSDEWLSKRTGALRRWEDIADAEKNYSEFSRFLQKCCNQ